MSDQIIKIQITMQERGVQGALEGEWTEQWVVWIERQEVEQDAHLIDICFMNVYCMG